LLSQEVDAIAAETGFSGVVRVDRGEEVELAKAFGLANRPYGIANTLDTQFGIASGTKALTAGHDRAAALAPVRHRGLPRREH
jgi:CubicO group peptidase (beta-lactamase class C family)